jgi:hypothetical protein
MAHSRVDPCSQTGIIQVGFRYTNKVCRGTYRSISPGNSTAPANQFVLLSWTCVTYATIAQNINITEMQDLLKQALLVFALLLDALLDKEAPTKPSLTRGAIVRVRRVLRSVRYSMLIKGGRFLTKSNSSLDYCS